jgi:hypothetical protein
MVLQTFLLCYVATNLGPSAVPYLMRFVGRFF